MSRTINDLLDVAIQHEVLSQNMYRAAEARVTDPEAKRFLRTLVEEEEGHERTLKEIKDMEIYDGSVALQDASILDAGESSHGGEIAADATIEQILDLALAREHRARTLFQSLAAAAAHPELKTLFENLAAEEDSHHEAIEKRFMRQRGEMGLEF